MAVMFPQVHVQLSGGSGNVYAIIGTVIRALKSARLYEAAEDFKREAFACKSYDAVLQLAMQTVEVS